MDDLDTYKAQLEQVQAALTTDPENEDLLKLQKDLEEVINLTLELAAPAPSTSSGLTSAFDDDQSEDAQPTPSSSSAAATSVSSQATSSSSAPPASQSIFASIKTKHSRAWKQASHRPTIRSTTKAQTSTKTSTAFTVPCAIWSSLPERVSVNPSSSKGVDVDEDFEGEEERAEAVAEGEKINESISEANFIPCLRSTESSGPRTAKSLPEITPSNETNVSSFSSLTTSIIRTSAKNLPHIDRATLTSSVQIAIECSDVGDSSQLTPRSTAVSPQRSSLRSSLASADVGTVSKSPRSDAKPEVSSVKVKLESAYSPKDASPAELSMQSSLATYSDEYLSQLLEDKRRIVAFPKCFHHLERLLDDEISRVRSECASTTEKPSKSDDGRAEEEMEGKLVQKQTRMTEKIYIPVQAHPGFNFVGRILGVGGARLRGLERETGCKIDIRGKGSMIQGNEKMLRGKKGFEHLDDDLHCLISVVEVPEKSALMMMKAKEEILRLLSISPDEEKNLKRPRSQIKAVKNTTPKRQCNGGRGGGGAMVENNTTTALFSAVANAVARRLTSSFLPSLGPPPPCGPPPPFPRRPPAPPKGPPPTLFSPSPPNGSRHS